jgi:hypothetical protein
MLAAAGKRKATAAKANVSPDYFAVENPMDTQHGKKWKRSSSSSASTRGDASKTPATKSPIKAKAAAMDRRTMIFPENDFISNAKMKLKSGYRE